MDTPLSLEEIPCFSETRKFLGLDEFYRETSSSSESPRVVLIVASLLENLMWNNTKKDGMVTLFNGTKAPELTVKQYIDRIFKYANISPSCIVVANIYIQKLTIKWPGFVLTPLNVHRILITSIMVAAKFLDDTCENNAYYALVGGISTDEINKLEIEFLFCLEFRLQVTVEVFAQYCQFLEQKGRYRGNRIHRSRSHRQRNRVTIQRAPTYEGQGCGLM